MSVHVSARVWKHSRQRGAAKLLLLALADHANANGLAWPGAETLAQAIGETPRHTRRLLKQLEADGELVSKIGGGRGHYTIYGIVVGMSDRERFALERALKRTVIKNTDTQDTVLSTNSDTQDRVSGNTDTQDTVLSTNSDTQDRVSNEKQCPTGTETVTCRDGAEAPFAAAARPETPQNAREIRHGTMVGGGGGNHPPTPSSDRRTEPTGSAKPAAPPDPATVLRLRQLKIKPSVVNELAVVPIADVEQAIAYVTSAGSYRDIAAGVVTTLREMRAGVWTPPTDEERYEHRPGSAAAGPVGSRRGRAAPHAAPGLAATPPTPHPSGLSAAERVRRRQAAARERGDA